MNPVFIYKVDGRYMTYELGDAVPEEGIVATVDATVILQRLLDGEDVLSTITGDAE